MTDRTVYLDGRAVVLVEPPLKSGGQAAVYAVRGDQQVVVKLYHDMPGPDQERRLTRMRTMSPLGGRPLDSAQPPELAWPTAIARNSHGKFIGYAMRRFGEPQHVQLVGLFTRSQRLKRFPDRADWRFLLGVGWNLAFMTARMHHEKLVIGDFSSNNVVVDANGFVTFLDCDSIAFTDAETGEVFPCLMHTTDYSAPERQAGGPATAASDDFALAVLVYQLLTAGNHPFGGVAHDSVSQSGVKDNIVSSVSYVVRPELVTVPRSTLDPSVLPPELLVLARSAFGIGVHDPDARPSAEAWLRALDKERGQVKRCGTRPLHVYGSHLSACPWCVRATTTGHDVFNAQAPTGAVPPPPRPPDRTPGSPKVGVFVLLAVLVIILLVVLAAN
ncbi:hypothetical protein [Streptomyces diastatochromogenes]|uniref:hypothetical protein n=1 Tax=Streptomyces diastatochromogenes TaxID=42236 RepID=UPI00369CAA97